jgi:hypothetical protein
LGAPEFGGGKKNTKKKIAGYSTPPGGGGGGGEKFNQGSPNNQVHTKAMTVSV